MQDHSFKTLTCTTKANGAAIVTIDVAERPVNVLTPEMYEDLHRLVDLVADEERIKGVVIQSGKKTFMAGGDLKRLVNYYGMNRPPQEAYEQSRAYTTALRKLELCGKPFAVAINGSAMGGGLELALACNYRVAVDDPGVYLGLPEVTLGLIPGAGGTQRLPRMIGIEKAADLILAGRRLTPQAALELGIVDEVAAREDLFAVAERLVLSGQRTVRPWDRKGFSVPGGAGIGDRRIAALFQQLNARAGEEYKHNYPAPMAALRCLYKGTATRSMDKALEIESREFSMLTRRVETRNIIRTLFLHKGAMDRLSARPENAPATTIQKIAFSADLDTPAHQSAIEWLMKSCTRANLAIDDDIGMAADLVLILNNIPLKDLPALGAKAPRAVFCLASPDLLEELVTADDAASGELYGRMVGMNIPALNDRRCLEIGTLAGATSAMSLAAVLDFSRSIRATPTVQVYSGQWLSTACLKAYQDEAQLMLEEGHGNAMVQNCGRFSGMKIDPLPPDSPGMEQSANGCAGQTEVAATVEQRLLVRQALVAATYLERGLIKPPDADVLSVLGWGFPAYLGGVASYTETPDIARFIELCDHLDGLYGQRFAVPAWLRALLAEDKSLYPRMM